MELCADDGMCQSYVVGKRASVEGMQERHEVFKSKRINLKICIFSGGKESS